MVQQWTIKEQFLAAKTGKLEDCEDAIFSNEHFVAVIDGATSKSDRTWNGLRGGQLAARLISQSLARIPADAPVQSIVEQMTAIIHDLYRREGIVEVVRADPAQRITASVVVVSFFHEQLFLVGDCQALLDGVRVACDNPIDAVTSQARALYLTLELLRGKTLEQLRQQDTGRDFIMPLLAAQGLCQNDPAAGDFWYPVIDGFPVPPDGVQIHSLADVQQIVLASDGYPVLDSELARSESILQELLGDDPLCFRPPLRSTKGVMAGNTSFDDRAFVRLERVAPTERSLTRQ